MSVTALMMVVGSIPCSALYACCRPRRRLVSEMARVIDEETEKILRRAQSRCRELLRTERNGLDLVARQLLEHETIDGAEVLRLVKVGRTGEPGHPPDPGSAPPADYLGSFTASEPASDSVVGSGDDRSDTPSHDTAEVH